MDSIKSSWTQMIGLMKLEYKGKSLWEALDEDRLALIVIA